LTLEEIIHDLERIKRESYICPGCYNANIYHDYAKMAYEMNQKLIDLNLALIRLLQKTTIQ